MYSSWAIYIDESENEGLSQVKASITIPYITSSIVIFVSLVIAIIYIHVNLKNEPLKLLSSKF